MTEKEKAAAAAAAAAAEAEARAKADADAKAKADADAKAAADAQAGQPTIAEAISTATGEAKEKDTVPLATFLEVKNDNKALRKDIDDLRAKIDAGASKSEVSADIEAIGKKYDVKPEFLTELSAAIRKQAEADAGEKIKHLTDADRQRKFEEVFATNFDKAMGDMPEFKDIVNREVIKALSLDPKNGNKTFKQLIEETYGRAVPAGKRTIETTTPRGGGSTQAIDFEKAKNDPEYFKEVMADPELKAEYNKGLTDRIGSML